MTEPEMDSNYEIVDHGDDTAQPMEEDAENDGNEPENEQQIEDHSLHCFTGHSDSVFAVNWNPKNTGQVASGGSDDAAFLWQTGVEEFDRLEGTTRELKGHGETVACLQFSGDGELLATGDLNGVVKIWLTNDASLLHTFEDPGRGIEWLSWHPRGHLLLAGSEDFTSWMWNVDSRAFMQVFRGHSAPVTCGQFCPDGRTIVTGGGEADSSLRVWDPKSGACTLTVQDNHTYHSAGLTALAIRSDSAAACSASEDHTARLINLHNGKVLGTFRGHTDSVEDVRFIENTSLVATCSVDGTLRVWDCNTSSQRASCPHPEAVVRIDCHPHRPIVVTACLDGMARSWDVLTGNSDGIQLVDAGALLQTLPGHTEGIQDLRISPAGTHLLTGSDDSSSRVFELAL